VANILTHATQSNFLSGILDPRAQGRVDTNAYVSSLLQGVNVELSHLGGVTRRRGLPYCQTMPNQLVQLTGTYSSAAEGATYYWSPTGNGIYQSNNTGIPATVITALGGVPTTDNGAFGSNKWGLFLTETTTEVGVINPFVVVSVDLGSAQTVQFADVTCLSLSSGSSTQFCIQSSPDNVNWTTVPTGGALPQVDSGNGLSGYAYRATGPITARYWRLARVGAANLGTAIVAIGDFTLWGTTSTVSAGRVIPFEVSITEQYAIVCTDRSGTVVNANNGAVILQNIPLPYSSAQLAAMDAQGSGETLVMTHQSIPTIAVIRQNSPLVFPTTTANYATYYNFQPFPLILSAIPQIDYDDINSPTPTADIQHFATNSGWNTGDTFTITLLTDTTGPITYAGDDYTAGGAGFFGATSKAVETAVQALWAVNGFTGVTCVAGSSAYTYVLTFGGAAAAPIGLVAVTSLSSNATATMTEAQVGVSRQENLWSPIRGYPAVVTFFQGRLWFGGMQSQQESVVGSWVNDILNFATAQGLDDQAIYVTMTGVALNAIAWLFPGKSLCIGTTGGEFRFINDQAQSIIPTSAPVNQTQYGGAQIKPAMIDGNIIFVQRNLKSLRDFQFDYTVDQFNSLGISALAPNLIYGVRDIAVWQGAVDDEINLLFACNGTNPSTDFDALPNGSCSVFNTRKEVSVQAWTNWQTQGLFMNVGTIVQNILFLVQRVINGVTVLTLEQPNKSTFTDCCYYANSGVAGLSQITVPWLAGATVRCLADGYVLDTQVVPANGIVPLTSDGRPYVVQGQVEIGLNFNPIVEPMPLQTVRWPAGSNLAHKKRIVALRAKVRLTQGLIISTEGGPDGQTVQIIPQMAQMDNFQMDSGPLPLYTGVIEVEASSTWDQNEDKMVTFTQVDPLPMQILFLDAELSGEQ
jgi:hypothetical protein